MANNIYYFSHDSNARNDEKVLMLRSKHGWAGYGIFWALVEMMFENGESRLSHSKLKGLAVSYNIDESILRDIIQTCIDEGLFASDDTYFWSDSLCRRKEKFYELKEKRSEAGSRGGSVRAERLREAREKGTHTKDEWEEMKIFFNFKCVACGCEIINDSPVSDHIIPLYKGGSDSITNIQPLCKSCNSSKTGDESDYRLDYCQANSKQMPSKWLAKPSKGKESKVKESNTKEHFEKFWQAYPKKRNKGDAEKSFKKVAPDEQLMAAILTAIEQAKKSAQWLKDDGQFIPYPATWLNAKGWEDEIIIPQGKKLRVMN